MLFTKNITIVNTLSRQRRRLRVRYGDLEDPSSVSGYIGIANNNTHITIKTVYNVHSNRFNLTGTALTAC